MLPDFGVAIWAGCEKLQGFAQSLGFFGHLGGVSSCVHSNTFASKTRIPAWNTSKYSINPRILTGLVGRKAMMHVYIYVHNITISCIIKQLI